MAGRRLGDWHRGLRLRLGGDRAGLRVERVADLHPGLGSPGRIQLITLEGYEGDVATRARRERQRRGSTLDTGPGEGERLVGRRAVATSVCGRVDRQLEAGRTARR